MTRVDVDELDVVAIDVVEAGLEQLVLSVLSEAVFEAVKVTRVDELVVVALEAGLVEDDQDVLNEPAFAPDDPSLHVLVGIRPNEDMPYLSSDP